MKHVALITASIELVDDLHVVRCLEVPDLRVCDADEETALAMARKTAAYQLADQVRYATRKRQEFADALSKLGDESVVPLDEEPAAAPITDTNDNEAGTPE